MSGETFNDPTKPLYPLRVASELSGTSIYSLRQYVDEGLIIPYKTSSNRRLYSQVDIKRIQCIRKYLDEFGLNIAGIKAIFAQVPCWLLKPSKEEECKECDAYQSPSIPCWQAQNKGPACQNENCRICPVYRLPEQCSDPKSIFKKDNDIAINYPLKTEKKT